MNTFSIKPAMPPMIKSVDGVSGDLVEKDCYRSLILQYIFVQMMKLFFMAFFYLNLGAPGTKSHKGGFTILNSGSSGMTGRRR